MERLTKKNDRVYSTDLYDVKINEYDYKNYSTDTSIGACLDKLGKLEDLEEQVGCPLDVVFKALKGFYYRNDIGGITQAQKPITITFDEASKVYYLESGDNEWTPYQYVPLKLYKKSFWLKEDKSE